MKKKQEAQSPASPIKKVQKKVSKTRPGLGAPSLEYNDEIADYICELIATNTTSMEKLCAAHPEIPNHSAIRKWVITKPGFASKYWEAKRLQTIFLEEEAAEITNNRDRDFYVDENGNLKPNSVSVSRDSLILKHIHWHVARVEPKKWGDRPTEDVLVKNAELEASVALLQAQLAATKELNKAHEKEY